MGEMNHMYSNLFFPMQLRKSKYWLQGIPLSFQNTKICASLSTIQEISSFPHWFSSKNPPHCSQTPHSWPQLTPVHTMLSQHATWPHLDLKVEVEDRFCVGKSIKWVMRTSWKKLGTSIFQWKGCVCVSLIYTRQGREGGRNNGQRLRNKAEHGFGPERWQLHMEETSTNDRKKWTEEGWTKSRWNIVWAYGWMHIWICGRRVAKLLFEEGSI